MTKLFEELKRRNVFRVGVAYLVVSWLVLQVADVILGNIGSPEWVFKTILLVLAIGFPVAVFLAWAFELTPEGVKRESEVDRTQSITRQTGRKLDFAIIAVLTLAVAYFAYDKFIVGHPEREPQGAATTAPEAGAPEEKDPSIAVLPFVNMSDDESNEYFSDGVTEEILNTLASVRELKVAGRTSAFAFKNKNEDLRNIGGALGVGHILEGSVRKSGTRVRITAQLIQVEDGFHMWSETFDRELTDVFAIQDEIANAILEALKTQLLAGEITPAHTTPTDPEAYDKFLIAKQRIYERNNVSLQAARELLEEAIAIDSGFAPAHAQLGITILLLNETGYGDLPMSEALRLSKPHLDTAVEIAPNLAEAWAGLGLYYRNTGSQHEKSVEALETALSLNPNLIDAGNWLQAEYGVGELQKKIRILEEIIARDPLYRPGFSNLIGLYNLLGRQEESLAMIERAEMFVSNDPWLARLRARTMTTQGRFAEALPLAEMAATEQPQDFVAQFTFADLLFRTHQWQRMPEIKFPIMGAYAPFLLGRREEALMAARDLAGHGFVFPLLDILALTGRHEELVELLNQRWPDLDDFVAEFPLDEDGYSEMNNVAFAFLKTGDARFSNAMAKIREAHDQAYEAGVISDFLDIEDACYWAMAGDLDRAIERVGSAVDKGYAGDFRIARMEPQLEPLEGDPRYEAIQARMQEKINQQRALLGLDPVET